MCQAENDKYDMAIYALKDTIRCAMEVRSQKLRPELRFLNKLLMLDSLGARIPVRSALSRDLACS